MHENIATIILLDKTETLGRIKPFYCTFFHLLTPLYFALLGHLIRKTRLVQAGWQAAFPAPNKEKPHNP